MVTKPEAFNVVNTLREHLNGAAVYGGSKGAPGVVPPLFNGAFNRQPLARVECRTIIDVQRALRITLDSGVPVPVLGGRADAWERAVQDGAAILDLSAMSRVTFNTAASEVTLQGGATTGQLLNGLPDDVVTVTCTNKTVGVVGFTLGGGYSRLNSRLGLAVDTMKSAEIVLAAGSTVTVSDSGDADVFWALRGGGTGFGVVTSITLATYPLPKVLSGMIFFPISAAKRALLGSQQMLIEFPDDLSILSVFTTAPTGERGLFLLPLWCGEPALGEQLLERITKLNGSQVLKQGWSTYKDSFESEDIWPWGRHYDAETQTVPHIDGAVADLLIEAVSKMSSPKSILFLHDFHGAPSRVAPQATAFPLRTDHFVVDIVAAWDADEEKDAPTHRVWVQEVSESLSGVAVPGGYINFLSSDRGDRARQFYGASADRLLKIKARVDPYDRFFYSTGHF